MDKEALFPKAPVIDGSTGDTGPENILSYAKVIGRHRFSDSLAAVVSRTAERERACRVLSDYK